MPISTVRDIPLCPYQEKSCVDLLLAMLIKQRVLRDQPFVVSSLEGRLVTVNGADFCFGIGTNLEEAEVSLKNQKELRKTSQQR